MRSFLPTTRMRACLQPENRCITRSSLLPSTSESKSNSGPFSNLPKDLLENIAVYLSDSSDLIHIEQTDHRWQCVLRRLNEDSLLRQLWAHCWKKYPHYNVLVLNKEEWIWRHPRWGPDSKPLSNLQAGGVPSTDISL